MRPSHAVVGPVHVCKARQGKQKSARRDRVLVGSICFHVAMCTATQLLFQFDTLAVTVPCFDVCSPSVSSVSLVYVDRIIRRLIEKTRYEEPRKRRHQTARPARHTSALFVRRDMSVDLQQRVVV